MNAVLTRLGPALVLLLALAACGTGMTGAAQPTPTSGPTGAPMQELVITEVTGEDEDPEEGEE